MRHSFRLEDNKNNKKTRMDYSLILMVFFILMAVACLITYFVMANQSSGQKINKLDTSKAYVYTVKKLENKNSESEETVYDKIPSINLKGKKYQQLNNEILNQYHSLVKNNNYIYYGYQFNQSGDILSLMVTYTYYPEQVVYPIINFETYHINLKSGKILTDQELLEMYQVSEGQIQVYLEAKFKKYYSDLVKGGYYTKKQCDYDCFLKNRGISKDYLEGTSFYVEDGKLTLFKYYYRDSIYHEIEFFKDDSYQFLIRE